MPDTLCQQRFKTNLRALLLTITLSISRCHLGMQTNNPRLVWPHVLIACHHIYPGFSRGFQCQQCPLWVFAQLWRASRSCWNEPSPTLFSGGCIYRPPSPRPIYRSHTPHCDMRWPVFEAVSLSPRVAITHSLHGCNQKALPQPPFCGLGWKRNVWLISQSVPCWPKSFQRRFLPHGWVPKLMLYNNRDRGARESG